MALGAIGSHVISVGDCAFAPQEQADCSEPSRPANVVNALHGLLGTDRSPRPEHLPVPTEHSQRGPGRQGRRWRSRIAQVRWRCRGVVTRHTASASTFEVHRERERSLETGEATFGTASGLNALSSGWAPQMATSSGSASGIAVIYICGIIRDFIHVSSMRRGRPGRGGLRAVLVRLPPCAIQGQCQWNRESGRCRSAPGGFGANRPVQDGRSRS